MRWCSASATSSRKRSSTLLIRAVAQMPGVRLLIVGAGAARRRAARAGRRGGARARRVARQHAAGGASLRVRGRRRARRCRRCAKAGRTWCSKPLRAARRWSPPTSAGSRKSFAATRPEPSSRSARRPHGRSALGAMIEAALPAERVRRYARQFGWDEVVTRQCALYEDVCPRARSDGRRTTLDDGGRPCVTFWSSASCSRSRSMRSPTRTSACWRGPGSA